MTWTEYVAAARRTQNKDLTPEQRLAHAALGMTSEWMELVEKLGTDMYNAADLELGDFCWFVVELMDSVGYEMTEAQFRENAYATALREDHPEHRMWKTIGRLNGLVQKTYQGHTLNGDAVGMYAKEALGYACAYGYHKIPLVEATLEKVFDKNVDKLLVRYPSAEGFTAEDSIRRVDVE